MRLIDADEALRRLPDGLPYKSSVRLNTRHQKRSCCRRNQCLKDNYKEA